MLTSVISVANLGPGMVHFGTFLNMDFKVWKFEEPKQPNLLSKFVFIGSRPTSRTLNTLVMWYDPRLLDPNTVLVISPGRAAKH